MAFDPPQNGVEPTRRGDIQKIKETLRQIEAMATVKTALPLLKPFMRLLGIDSTGIEASLQDVEKLRTDIKALSTIPDDFNDLLSDRGWIIYTAAPATVREETRKPPTWVESPSVPSEGVAMITDDLDLGERAAVAPAGTVHAGLLLIDEAAGRLDETLSSAVFDRWLQP